MASLRRVLGSGGRAPHVRIAMSLRWKSAARCAGMDAVGLNRTSLAGWLLLAAAAAANAWRAAALWRAGTLAARVGAAACALLALGVALAVCVDRAPAVRQRLGR